MRNRGVEQVRRERPQHPENATGDDAEIDPLPDRRADPQRPTRPRILRHERTDVPRRALDEREKQPEHHRGGHRRAHRIGVVLRKKRTIDRELNRRKTVRQDQRRSQRQKLAARTLPRIRNVRSHSFLLGNSRPIRGESPRGLYDAGPQPSKGDSANQIQMQTVPLTSAIVLAI